MKSINLKYYFRLFSLYIEYIRKKSILKNPPIRMWIELTSHCNLKCVMCPNKDLTDNQKGYMQITLFKKIIDEIKDKIFDISLLHRGESLLHPEFNKFLEYIGKFDIKTKLHTNGTLLTEEIAKSMITNKLSRLSFSFDGYTAKTYEKIRVGAKFDEVVKNIIMIQRMKKELNSKYPEVVIELIDFPNSEISDKNKRKEFLELFGQYKPDSIIVKKLHNWAGYMKNMKKTNKKPKPCTHLWNGLLILWNGTAMPCSQDFFEYYKLENAKEKSVMEIWNGERLVNLREKHIKGDISDLKTCNNCDRIWRKTFMGVPVEYLKELIFRRMP